MNLGNHTIIQRVTGQAVLNSADHIRFWGRDWIRDN